MHMSATIEQNLVAGYIAASVLSSIPSSRDSISLSYERQTRPPRSVTRLVQEADDAEPVRISPIPA